MATHEEMTARLKPLFDLVCDKKNWKNPIRATVDKNANIAGIKEAIIFYTGSVPTITETKKGYRVVADGYYLTIGA